MIYLPYKLDLHQSDEDAEWEASIFHCGIYQAQMQSATKMDVVAVAIGRLQRRALLYPDRITTLSRYAQRAAMNAWLYICTHKVGGIK